MGELADAPPRCAGRAQPQAAEGPLQGGRLGWGSTWRMPAMQWLQEAVAELDADALPLWTQPASGCDRPDCAVAGASAM